MLTYSARIESTDTLFMFDATASLVRFGDMRLDLTAGERRFWDYEEPLPELPLLPVNAEPLQIILASPLYWLADHIPQIGRVHTVWLFNVFTTTLTVGLFFLYALQLGHQNVTALIGALFFALGTIIWPYSKTFFQEPLTMLLILSAAYLVERWRASGFRMTRFLIAAVLTFVLAVLARRAAVVVLPVLLIIAFPWLDTLFRSKWTRGGLLAIVGITAALIYTQPSTPFRDGMHAYLFSIGGSIWGTSPILLLAVPGIIMLGHRNRMRYVLAALTILLAYAFTYAYASGGNWFGGLSWPPRFLVPTVPFLMLCALPVIDWMRQTRSKAALVIASLLMLYSLWVQFNAVSYWWGEYVKLLPSQAGGFTEWSGGLNDVRYLRWVILPQLWGVLPFDFVWVRTGEPLFALLFIMGASSAAGCLLWMLLKPHQLNRPAQITLTTAPPLIFVMLVAIGLWLIRVDDEYLAFSNGLQQAVPVINSELHQDDILLISQLGYERFFLNYGEVRDLRVISLPEHPGEQPSPDQPAQITSPNPADLLENPTVSLVNLLAQRKDHLWVMSHSAPYISWTVRPLERYMASVYFPLRTIDTSGGDGLPVRLIEYVTAAQHDPYALMGPQHSSSLRYGDNIALAGYTLPLGEAYTPGDSLPIALYWIADETPSENYTIAFYLAQEGVVASGEDSQPYAGFAPTSTWATGQPVWDNRALRLPDNLPPGEYRLWVAVYGFDESGAPALLNVTDGESAENGTIGVLPAPIAVTAP